MSDCIGPINIIPDNNQVVLLDNNKSITVIDNNCCTNVDITQPITSVIQVLTGPIGPMGEFPTSGSFNLTGSINVTGSITANYFYGGSFSGSFTGSFSGSTTDTLQDVTNNGNVTTLPITASSFYGNGLQIVGNATVTGSLIVSGSNTFRNIGPAQFTGSVDVLGTLTAPNITGSLYGTASWAESSSYTLQALSSSYALTASYLDNYIPPFPYTGSATITGSLEVTGSVNMPSITGSLLGTSSWAENSITASYITLAQTASYVQNAISASYTDTASFAPAYLPLTGGTINGDVIVNGTASVTFLNVTYESSSVIYSSGSNQFGDNTDDIQLLIGTVKISGSQQITGSSYQTGTFYPDQIDWINSSIGYNTGSYILTTTNNGLTVYANYQDIGTALFPYINTGSFNGLFTGSLLGTASWAVNAVTASYVANASSFPFTGSAIISGSLTITGSVYAPDITGSLYGTASYALNADSSSYTLSASYALSSSHAITASYALTASYAEQASDIVLKVINQSGAQINKGIVVRITASNNSSDTPRIGIADWTNDNLSANTLGLVMSNIPNGDTGLVLTEGLFLGYDTSTPGWTNGQVLYLGPSGSITGSTPLAPLHSVRLGQVIRVQSNNGSIYIRIDNGYELEELHDVLTTNELSGDLLVRSSSVWINSKQLTGSYGLTGSLNATSFTGSLFGTASWAESSSFALTASYVANASSFPFTGSAIITGSLVVTGSVIATEGFTGSLQGTASYATSTTLGDVVTAAANLFNYYNFI